MADCRGMTPLRIRFEVSGMSAYVIKSVTALRRRTNSKFKSIKLILTIRLFPFPNAASRLGPSADFERPTLPDANRDFAIL